MRTLSPGFVLFGFVCLTTALQAQVSDANLTGIVRDPSALVIAGASAELIQIDTGVRRNAESSVEGVYRFPNVPAGNYELRVTAAGFAPINVKDLQLEAGRNHTCNVGMQVQSSATT